MDGKRSDRPSSKGMQVQPPIESERNRFSRSSGRDEVDASDNCGGRLSLIQHWHTACTTSTSSTTRPTNRVPVERVTDSESDDLQDHDIPVRLRERPNRIFNAGCSTKPKHCGNKTTEAGSSDDEEHKIKKRFDWVWDKDCKSNACQVMQDEHVAHFHLDYSCGTAACRGSMEMSEGQHYWEIKMVSAVYGTDMMVGIGTKEIDFSHYAQTFCSLLGNDNNGESCGLSYTGAFHFSGCADMFCTKFGQKATIGLHLDMWKGHLSFYKNGKHLGIAKTGLLGKSWYPMICSTAARSSMRLIRAHSYMSTLQFMCCAVLRRHIPPNLDVLEALAFPPGLKNYLDDNLGWLLGPQIDTSANIACHNKATQTMLTISGKLFSVGQDGASGTSDT